jgi:hypothetical protein
LLIYNGIKLETVCQLNPVGKSLPTSGGVFANLLLRADVRGIAQLRTIADSVQCPSREGQSVPVQVNAGVFKTAGRDASILANRVHSDSCGSLLFSG